jgi:hypothetical protein
MCTTCRNIPCLTKYMPIADKTLPLAPTDWHMWFDQAIWVGEANMRGPLWPCINLSRKFGMKNWGGGRGPLYQRQGHCRRPYRNAEKGGWSVMMTLPLWPCSCMKFCRGAVKLQPGGQSLPIASAARDVLAAVPEDSGFCSLVLFASSACPKCTHTSLRLV